MTQPAVGTISANHTHISRYSCNIFIVGIFALKLRRFQVRNKRLITSPEGIVHIFKIWLPPAVNLKSYAEGNPAQWPEADRRLQAFANGFSSYSWNIRIHTASM